MYRNGDTFIALPSLLRLLAQLPQGEDVLIWPNLNGTFSVTVAGKFVAIIDCGFAEAVRWIKPPSFDVAGDGGFFG